MDLSRGYATGDDRARARNERFAQLEPIIEGFTLTQEDRLMSMPTVLAKGGVAWGRPGLAEFNRAVDLVAENLDACNATWRRYHG